MILSLRVTPPTVWSPRTSLSLPQATQGPEWSKTGSPSLYLILVEYFTPLRCRPRALTGTICNQSPALGRHKLCSLARSWSPWTETTKMMHRVWVHCVWELLLRRPHDSLGSNRILNCCVVKSEGIVKVRRKEDWSWRTLLCRGRRRNQLLKHWDRNHQRGDKKMPENEGPLSKVDIGFWKWIFSTFQLNQIWVHLTFGK